jgi:hypothetical protein
MISTEAVPGGRSAGSLAWAGGNTYLRIPAMSLSHSEIMSLAVPT